MLVSGARGFLGRHLVRRLRRAGADVHAVTRHLTGPADGGLSWHEVDLTDAGATEELLERVRPDVVMHLASRVQGHREPDLVLPMLEANTQAAISVMDAARRLPGCRVVLAGSVEEPGPGEAPVSPYAAAKAATTGYARLYHDQWELPVTVLRLSMVYGPDQPDDRKLVPSAAQAMLAGEVPALSSGGRGIDWVYIDDVCDAFLLAATRPDAPGAVVEIGSGRAVTVADTVRALADSCHYTGPLGFGDMDDRTHDVAHVADPAPAQRLLGWRPRTPLADGLARTARWYAGDAPAG